MTAGVSRSVIAVMDGPLAAGPDTAAPAPLSYIRSGLAENGRRNTTRPWFRRLAGALIGAVLGLTGALVVATAAAAPGELRYDGAELSLTRSCRPLTTSPSSVQELLG